MSNKIVIDARMIGHSGIGRYVQELLTQYNSLNCKHHFSLILNNYNTLPDRSSFETVEVNTAIFSIKEQILLPRKISCNKYDLLHCPQFNVPLLTNVPLVLTVHDCTFDRFPEEFPNKISRFYYQFMFPAALRKARKIIAISDSTKKELIHFYQVPEEKISVIYLGVGEKFFQRYSNEKIFAFKQELGITEEYILYVGLTRPRKNLDRILRAFARFLSQSDRKHKLVLVGNIDKRFLDVDKLVNDLNIRDNVLELGFVSDDNLLKLYQGASFLLFPSLYEGFGLPVLEAMALGTPVLTSNVSSLPEVAGDAALLVDPYNIEGIARGIKELSENPNIRESLIRKGKLRAAHFSWDKCARETMAVYEAVLNEKN
jgi:glycosyltransferase involved in cell wall biosynthesis